MSDRTAWPFPFRDRSHRNQVLLCLLRQLQCGPFDGGCVALALALQRVHGGNVVVIDGQLLPNLSPTPSFGAQHAMLQLPDGRYVDADGVADTADLAIKRFNSVECRNSLAFARIRSLEAGDLPEAPRDEAVVSKLAQALQEPPDQWSATPPRG